MTKTQKAGRPVFAVAFYFIWNQMLMDGSIKIIMHRNPRHPSRAIENLSSQQIDRIACTIL